VVVPVGTLNHLNVLKWAEKAGLAPEDMNFVHMDNASAFQAFRAGEADITAFSPPMSFAAEAEGWLNAADGERLGLEIWDPLLANPRTINQKYDQIVAFVRVLHQVHDLFASNPELAAEWSVKWQALNGNTVPIENARREVAARPFPTSARARVTPVGQTMYDVAEFFNSIGNLEDDELARIKPNLRDDVIKRALGF